MLGHVIWGRYPGQIPNPDPGYFDPVLGGHPGYHGDMVGVVGGDVVRVVGRGRHSVEVVLVPHGVAGPISRPEFTIVIIGT